MTGAAHVGEPVPQEGTPFALLTGPFISPLNVPCTEPPFGMIGVVDLKTGKMNWQRPLGTSADSGPFQSRSFLPLPMGVPIYIESTDPLTNAPMDRLTLAQDTGSAIKGALRGDLFFGWGSEAEARAGRMRQPGRAWLLLPRALPTP